MTRPLPQAPFRWGRSLLARTSATMLIATVSIGLLAVAVSAHIVRDQRHADLLRRAELVAATQADALSGAVWELDSRSVQSTIDALLARDPAIRDIVVYEATRPPPLARATAAMSATDSAATLRIDRPIVMRDREGRTETVGRLDIVYSTAEEWQATLDALVPVVGLLLLSLLAAIGLLGVTLNRIILRPLQRLTQLARAMARGDYGARIDSARSDEIGVLALSFNRMAETVQDHTQTLETRVQERTEALAATNRAIMDSINYAQLIQSSILPSADSLSDGLRDHMVLWRPRDVVSGDFYLYRPTTSGFVIAVVDCTGHGVPGAFMTMTASAMLNNALDQLGADDPAAILTAVDAKVRTTLNQDGEARTLAQRFDNGLDLALCHVVPTQGRLTFASARIPLLIVNDDGVTEVRGDRDSLGYRRLSAEVNGPRFTNHIIGLQPHQSFFLSTDGLTDQNGGELGRRFGKQRLRDELAYTQNMPLSEIKAILEHRLDRFQTGRSQRDDITLIGFRV
ncbi:SpoIIE family protein phosphatase [Azospirillum griseum]|uniref:HAMP domain-containing protein n=1 Tax=Azospirillum griseum TaxID=2496639 RepID=A0A3S0I216_9PROT|nr:SpoIIE family protein phosphatase [Azospirillum griseum]RTR21449.1 HAMP domain-containing protein [Azospirillum griseum]